MWLDRSVYDSIVDLCFFFFSSRRRHTRLQGDWSSDVCSSDLIVPLDSVGRAGGPSRRFARRRRRRGGEIGRGAWRGRGEISGGGGSLKKKKKKKRCRGKLIQKLIGS